MDHSSNKQIAGVFLYGFKLDLSASCYLLLLPCILLTIHNLVHSSIIEKVVKAYHLVLLWVISFLTVSNIALYDKWNSLINNRALGYLKFPGQVLASIPVIQLVIYLLGVLILFLCLRYLFRAVVNDELPAQEIKPLYSFSVVLGMLALITIGIRGGIQQIPINESSAYFSGSLTNNHVATNQVWYLGHNLLATDKEELKQFHFMDESEANKIVKSLLPACKDSSEKVLNVKNPNIVMIVMESMTANVIKSFGGLPGITPFIDSIANEGLIFTNIYSSGFRTDQGLVSIFSGFPAQPGRSIIRIPSKFEKMPFITSSLYKNGYRNLFFYGGESSFDNMEAYLRSGNVDHIVNENSFSKAQQNSKWGAHDEFVFSKMNETLANETQPFFATLLTLSNHEPFELPGISTSNKTDPEKFKLTASYTDRCLKNFFKKASSTAWYKNTLFIILADHGHTLPNNADINAAAGRHIPLIFYGTVLKEEFKGSKKEMIAGQHDLAKTLLNQLNIKSDEFHWSRDLLCTSYSNDYAFITNEQGFTWVDDSTQVASYSHIKDPVIYYLATGPVNVKERIKKGKAYLQCLFTEYVNY
jgi:phosphoglycerol transferase MdoB-like AlkP superfamily enzyme